MKRYVHITDPSKGMCEQRHKDALYVKEAPEAHIPLLCMSLNHELQCHLTESPSGLLILSPILDRPSFHLYAWHLQPVSLDSDQSGGKISKKEREYHDSLLLVTLITLLYKDANFLGQNFFLSLSHSLCSLSLRESRSKSSLFGNWLADSQNAIRHTYMVPPATCFLFLFGSGTAVGFNFCKFRVKERRDFFFLHILYFFCRISGHVTNSEENLRYR